MARLDLLAGDTHQEAPTGRALRGGKAYDLPMRTGRQVVAYLSFCEQVLTFGEMVGITPAPGENIMEYVQRQMWTYDRRRGLR